MNAENFEELFPGLTEGESMASRAALQLLDQEQNSLPKGSWVWVGVPIAIALARLTGASWAIAFGCAGFVVAFELIDLLRKILVSSLEIKIQMEYLKGSIRENRLAGITNREILLDQRRSL